MKTIMRYVSQVAFKSWGVSAAVPVIGTGGILVAGTGIVKKNRFLQKPIHRFPPSTDIQNAPRTAPDRRQIWGGSAAVSVWLLTDKQIDPRHAAE